MKFAPVRMPPSTRLLFVAGYFTLTGALMFALVVVSVVIQGMFVQAATALPALTASPPWSGALLSTSVVGLILLASVRKELR